MTLESMFFVILAGLLGGLISFWIAWLIVNVDGPFDLCLKFRIRVGVYEYGEDGRPITFIGKLFSCPLCVGFWVAIPVTLFVLQDIEHFLVAFLLTVGIQWYATLKV